MANLFTIWPVFIPFIYLQHTLRYFHYLVLFLAIISCLLITLNGSSLRWIAVLMSISSAYFISISTLFIEHLVLKRKFNHQMLIVAAVLMVDSVWAIGSIIYFTNKQKQHFSYKYIILGSLGNICEIISLYIAMNV